MAPALQLRTLENQRDSLLGTEKSAIRNWTQIYKNQSTK